MVELPTPPPGRRSAESSTWTSASRGPSAPLHTNVGMRAVGEITQPKPALEGEDHIRRKQAAGSWVGKETSTNHEDAQGSVQIPAFIEVAYRLMMQAALSVAFFDFLRVSKFTTNRKVMTRGRFLTRKDVLLTPDELKLNIKYSKTDQLGNGSSISMGLTGEVCCPVLTMKSYLKCCHAKPGTPLFHFTHDYCTTARTPSAPQWSHNLGHGGQHLT